MTELDKMVEDQIIARGVSDEKVLEVMCKVDRRLFVPARFKKIAYSDEPLPVGHGQTISQPYIVAYMMEAVNLKSGDRVLEIGTGSGYQTALLAEIVKEVYTIELIETLASAAADRLRSLGYKNINFKSGDGYAGWPEEAPFDAVIITAAPPYIPEAIAGQLKVGGKMVVPAGELLQELYLVTKKESGFDKEDLMSVRFVPMIRRTN